MSSINDIVAQIAGLSINGYVGHYSTTLRNSAESAVLPYRFISHRGSGITVSEFTRTTFSGYGYNASWLIRDICLLRAINAGIGLSDVSFNVYSYLGEFVSQARNIATNKYSIEMVDGDCSVLEWPDKSGKFYDAIIVTLVVKETN